MTISSTLDRTWIDDGTRVHVETQVQQFSVDAVRGDFHETVTVRGELDLATTPLVLAVLDTVAGRRPGRVEVDLSAVTFLDAQAIVAVAAARRRLAAAGTALVLRDPSPIVRHVLELTGFDRDLEITGTVPSASGRPSRVG